MKIGLVEDSLQALIGKDKYRDTVLALGVGVLSRILPAEADRIGCPPAVVGEARDHLVFALYVMSEQVTTSVLRRAMNCSLLLNRYLLS